jgi:hypothetical protein
MLFSQAGTVPFPKHFMCMVTQAQYSTVIVSSPLTKTGRMALLQGLALIHLESLCYRQDSTRLQRSHL